MLEHLALRYAASEDYVGQAFLPVLPFEDDDRQECLSYKAPNSCTITCELVRKRAQEGHHPWLTGPDREVPASTILAPFLLD